MSQELIPVNQPPSTALVADEYARQNVFTEYQECRSKNTLRRQAADIDLFAKCLAEINLYPGDLMNDPSAWKDVSFGLIETFKRWMKEKGYAIGSINVRLATVKTYAELAMKAGCIKPETYALIATVKGYTHKEGKNVDQNR